MPGPTRPRRPAMLDPQVAEQIRGDEDPAWSSEAAFDTAAAVVGRADVELDLVSRVRELVAADGLDQVAVLWSRSPAPTLPGALWRLYLLGEWLSRDPETIMTRFRDGEAHALEHADDAAATDDEQAPQRPSDDGQDGAGQVPAPGVLDERLTALFNGEEPQALAELCEHGARFLTVLAHGASDAREWSATHSPRAREVSGRTDALQATAAELREAGRLAQAGQLA